MDLISYSNNINNDFKIIDDSKFDELNNAIRKRDLKKVISILSNDYETVKYYKYHVVYVALNKSIDNFSLKKGEPEYIENYDKQIEILGYILVCVDTEKLEFFLKFCKDENNQMAIALIEGILFFRNRKINKTIQEVPKLLNLKENIFTYNRVIRIIEDIVENFPF